MNRKHVEEFLEARFPLRDESYELEWKIRFKLLDCASLIPWQMDNQSRRVWGKVTGRKYALVKHNYGETPTFTVINLVTGTPEMGVEQ